MCSSEPSPTWEGGKNDFFNTFSLYIHLPWCLKKCPYCDFNSHELSSDVPEEAYLNALFEDLSQEQLKISNRTLISIFFGGGTPSLFSPEAINRILERVQTIWSLDQATEITLEANPGTFEQKKFAAFRQAGINRLSIGVQSFQDEKLKQLGRIHCEKQAVYAVEKAQQAGFDNINIDLMYGLPNQSLHDALFDLETAFSLSPSHISWYQLTIEPNTIYAAKPPVLPTNEKIWEIQEAGQIALEQAGFDQYEVSAYAKSGQSCLHNLNYWQFGDYLGIGAGAHSKLTTLNPLSVERSSKLKYPRAYLNANKHFIAEKKIIESTQLPFEFMLNALRLKQSIPVEWFTQRTGLPLKSIAAPLKKAADNNFLIWNQKTITLTSLGWQFMNDVLQVF
jgi:putative oxygen-independent coproporphyrinogen III oxidase